MNLFAKLKEIINTSVHVKNTSKNHGNRVLMVFLLLMTIWKTTILSIVSNYRYAFQSRTIVVATTIEEAITRKIDLC